MSTDLLPCPYCGSEAEIHSFYGSNSDKVLYIPRCTSDTCIGHHHHKSYTSKAEAIAAWNRRFVGLDKNEDKVYAGDKVKYQPEDWKQLSLIGHIVKQELPYHGYHIVREDDNRVVINAFLPEDIELIKEAMNEH